MLAKKQMQHKTSISSGHVDGSAAALQEAKIRINQCFPCLPVFFTCDTGSQSIGTSSRCKINFERPLTPPVSEPKTGLFGEALFSYSTGGCV
jgi:hypothetical protein